MSADGGEERKGGLLLLSGTRWRGTAHRAEAQALVESLAQGSAGESEGVRTTTKNKIDVLLISPFHKHLLTFVSSPVILSTSGQSDISVRLKQPLAACI